MSEQDPGPIAQACTACWRENEQVQEATAYVRMREVSELFPDIEKSGFACPEHARVEIDRARSNPNRSVEVESLAP